MSPKKTAPDWERLAEQFNQPSFITADPVSFPHRFKSNADWRNAECAGFITALFSYGRRDSILNTVNGILKPLGENPVETLTKQPTAKLAKSYKQFYYRFNKAPDLVFLLTRLGEIYQDEGSLKSFWQNHSRDTLAESIHTFREAFLTGGNITPEDSYGLKFLFADPGSGSAAKRFNMFLRWMSRKDNVDLGLWQDVLDPSQLIIPLDTHVAQMARRFDITRRNANDWRTAEEITAYFRKRCPADPVRYDFALFGLGIEEAANKRKATSA
jgi:uncharacterized protein (TIGR02757 family)